MKIRYKYEGGEKYIFQYGKYKLGDTFRFHKEVGTLVYIRQFAHPRFILQFGDEDVRAFSDSELKQRQKVTLK